MPDEARVPDVSKASGDTRPSDEPPVDLCEVCGSDRLSWRNCKLICANCRSIVKSCADL